ncbi:class I mannose-6-phosphate isomerase [Alicyclobacillaceae bacterium I2511]|nr:class I mannose-6-phosphate isomerase [Alicyclobacillaceae bacterium I2511]
MQAYPVKFKAIPVERIWGGSRLKSWFQVQEGRPIGEYWVLSGHPNGVSIVENGPLAGMNLLQLVEEHPEEYLGDSVQTRFPLLIKFLEANQDLSVQVHPDDVYAQAVEHDFGKTEAWYVLDCPKDASVIRGHQFASRANFEQAAKTGNLVAGLLHQSIAPGDFVDIPAKTLHALLAGTVVVEVQQTSDITYRIYDWNRIDPKSGKGRDLHLKEATAVLDFPDGTETLIENSIQNRVLVNEPGFHLERRLKNRYFTVDWLQLENRWDWQLGHPGNPDVLVCVDGTGKLVWPTGEIFLKRGDTVLLPAHLLDCRLETGNHFTALRVFY